MRNLNVVPAGVLQKSVIVRPLPHLHLHRHVNHTANAKSLFSSTSMSQLPHVVSKEELSAAEARWVTLEKIKYRDQDGKERTWEAATRKTRKESGVDGVAILAILQPQDNTPPATVIIEQYRPPVDKFVIELPAGLVDAGETPEHAAIRELREETGFEAAEIIESSSLLVNDPGMSTANMKLVVLRVPVKDENALNLPEQSLDPGEHIVCKTVKLIDLHQVLNDYSQKGFVVDARLAHFALGYHFNTRLERGAT